MLKKGKMKSPKEVLHEHCAKNDGCLMAGQPKWIAEAMEDYANQKVREVLGETMKKMDSALMESAKIRAEINKIKQIIYN